MLTLNDLGSDQIECVKLMKKRKVAYVKGGCGFGKTICALTLIKWLLKEENANYKALIVSTKKGIEDTWSKEHLKFSHTKDLKVVTFDGTPAKNLEKLKDDFQIRAISYGKLKWLNKNLDTYYDIVIADESSCMKGVSSSFRKLLLNLAKQCQYKFAMSATPRTRDDRDYWGGCFFLDGGKRLGTTMKAFEKEFMTEKAHRNENDFERLVFKRNADKMIRNRIKDIFMYYGSPEPEHKMVDIDFKLKPESYQIYKKLERENIIQAASGRIITEAILNAPALRQKLNQLASGFVYVEETPEIPMATLANIELIDELEKIKPIRKTEFLFNDRIEQLKKLISSLSGNLIIVYYYPAELEQIKALLPEGVSDKEKNIADRWNKGEIKYLFLQAQRSSMSLNLQQGGHQMIFYSLFNSWADYYQIIRRILRRNQENEVTIYRLLCSDTPNDQKKKKRMSERGESDAGFSEFLTKEYMNVRQINTNT